jgi:hypothetical protein
MAFQPLVFSWNRENIGSITWPRSETAEIARAFLVPILQQRVETHIENVHADLELLQVDDHIIPVVVADSNELDAWIVSLYSQFVCYPLDELRRHCNRTLANICSVLPIALGGLLRLGRTNRIVYVNNWLTSTSLYPALGREEAAAILEYLVDRFPRHAIVFRSLNWKTVGPLFQTLLDLRGRRVFTRHVYVFSTSEPNRATKSQRAHLRRDYNLLKRHDYEILSSPPVEPPSPERLKKLYDDLYIFKYSKFNPRYTIEFFRAFITRRQLPLLMLRKNGMVDAVSVLFALNGVSTVPIFGYDMSLPKATGLYRSLSAATLSAAQAGGLIDHAGSGAGEFKSQRGYEQVAEYAVAFTRHLPWVRRLVWRLLAWYADWIVYPFSQRYG